MEDQVRSGGCFDTQDDCCKTGIWGKHLGGHVLSLLEEMASGIAESIQGGPKRLLYHVPGYLTERLVLVIHYIDIYKYQIIQLISYYFHLSLHGLEGLRHSPSYKC